MRTLGLALLVVGCLITDVALACTAPTCTRAVVFPASGNIPADQLRLLYTPSTKIPFDDASVALPRLYRLEGTTKVSVAYELEHDGANLWLTPTIEQPLGTQLVLESDASNCDVDEPLSATYSITEKRPLPSTLGTLQAKTYRGVIPIALGSGGCSELADVSYAELSVSLSDAANPFAWLWRYELYVDGKPHTSFIDPSSASYRLPQGLDRIYAQCTGLDAGAQGTTALTPGTHTVHVTARLGEATLTTPDVQVELRCDGPKPSGPIDAGVAAEAPSAQDSCALASRSPSWLALALLALLARRRSRQLPRSAAANGSTV